MVMMTIIMRPLHHFDPDTEKLVSHVLRRHSMPYYIILYDIILYYILYYTLYYSIIASIIL